MKKENEEMINTIKLYFMQIRDEEKYKELTIKIKVKEDDFCESDLKEVLEEGFENVGNHTLIHFEVEK